MTFVDFGNGLFGDGNFGSFTPAVVANRFPSLTVNIGFLAASNASGVAGWMTFNDPVNGQLGVGQFAPTYEWTDVTADFRSLTTNRGRQRQIEAFPAGTCTLVLDNNRGDYDPDNPNSQFWQGGATTLLPMRPIQILAGWGGINYPIFYGYIDQIQPAYSQGRFSDAWVTITASDAMKVLQNVPSSGASLPAESTGARIGHILDSINWPTALRSLDPGDVTAHATTINATIGQDIQATVDAEFSRWYIGTAGEVIFESRSSRNYNQTPISTWSDTNTNGFLYSDISRIVDDDLIRNYVSVQTIGGKPQVATDATSITQYQKRSFTMSNVLLLSDSDAAELAAVIIYLGKQTFGTRFDAILFEPIGDPNTLWPEVLGRAISDHIAVELTPPYVPKMTMGAYIEGVSHQITAGNPMGWTVTFHASRVPVQTHFFQFNDPTYGTLSTTNTFAY